MKVPTPLLLLAVSVLAASCVIVKHGSPEDKRAAAGQPSSTVETFDAAAFVAGIWESKLLPEAADRAVDYSVLAAALKADPEAARTKYGLRKEEASPYAFLVKVTAKVTAVDTESSASTAALDLPVTADGAEVKVQLGPVIMSSAVRDAVSFVRFGDFTNQVDWANVSREMNFRVRDTVVKPLDKASLKGKTVTFTAAFLESPDGNVLLTPVVWK